MVLYSTALTCDIAGAESHVPLQVLSHMALQVLSHMALQVLSHMALQVLSHMALQVPACCRHVTVQLASL
jgi:hypothetical protein